MNIGDNMIGIHLKNNKISLNELKKYNKPEYVYIPYETEDTIYVKKNEYIYKGMIIGKKKNGFPILSSISGEFIDIEEHLNSENIKCIKIKNDFKEKIEKSISLKEDITKYSKDEFINLLKEKVIIGMGGSGFPTFLKYQTDNIHTLIVNAVECEPYITADHILIEKHLDEILEGIDAILEINKIDECFIAIKKNQKQLKQMIENHIGTYLKIKLIEVPNLYPMGWERNLVKYIKKVDYDKLPIEKNIVVNNISTIYAIYKALKYQEPLLERIITVTGEIKEPTNILVKIGTNLNDILNYLEIKEKKVIIGGPMMGKKIIDDNFIITAATNNILIKKEEILEETTCLRCGKCILCCPAKITPVLIKDNINNLEKLKKLQVEKCMECGICSYICPAKINVREFVKTAKERIKGEQNEK